MYSMVLSRTSRESTCIHRFAITFLPLPGKAAMLFISASRRIRNYSGMRRANSGEQSLCSPTTSSGKVDLDHVLKSGGRTSTQRQELRVEQVGSVETEIPGIIDTAAAAPVLSKLEAAPPTLRPELSTDKKVLTVAEPIAKLNNFQLFLALSDRATRIEGEFLHYPHTTKLIWGSHRIVYIFTDSAGELSLYYDIELKEPLESATTGGAMFPTTTIITKDRTYVPVPSELEPAFRIAEGAKEFLCPLRYHSLVGVLHVGRRST